MKHIHFAELHVTTRSRLIVGMVTAILCSLEPLAAPSQSFSPAPAVGDETVTVITASVPVGTPILLFAATTAASCDNTSTPVPLAPYTNNVVLSGSRTTLTLAAALAAGEVMCATLGSTSIPGAQVAAAPAPPGFDWGLVRAYFTLGGLLSQADSQFSHTDMFMSFHLDKTYKQLKNLNDSGRHSYHPGLNSFFDVRLTAVPVAVQPCASSSSSSTGCSSSPSSSGSPSSSTPSTQVFLNSQKSARLQFGVYTPFMLDRWHIDARTGPAKSTLPVAYGLYIAPLAKTGFDTSINSLNQTQQSSATPAFVQPVGSSSSFYKFYDFGFRVGHYELSGDSGRAPNILSFLDVAWGRFSNMASLMCPAALYSAPSGCNAPSGTSPLPSLSWTHDWRLNTEGLLEVPASRGFSIGFSANVSQPTASTKLNGHTFIHINPQDDLRFLFAYRFDIAGIASKLAGQ